jgi:hypothetical protein
MPAPPTATDLAYPDWTDLVDTWRERDAEWLRNRVVSLWADGSGRTAGQPSPMKGALSSLQNGYGAPDFWTGSAWESIRYPNLDVLSDATSVTLRRLGAGSGIQLINDGSVNTVKNVVGTGGLGYVGDQTGIALHVGAKTVKLATDATGLTVDSPVSITGALTLTGALNAASATIPNITSTGTISAAAITSSSHQSTGAITGATVTGGDVLLGSAPPYGTVKHKSGGTAAVSVGSDSTVKIDGSTLTVNPATTFAGAATFNGTTSLNGATSQLAPAGKVAVQVAGVIAVSGNVAPTQNAPDGTLYVTY